MQYDLVTVVASRRGVSALKHLLSELPSSFKTPIACLVESTPGLARDLQLASRLAVQDARAGMRIESGHVYVSRPGESFICLADGTLGIVPCGAESSAMFPVDGCLGSAAKVHGRRVLSLVLSGFDHDGVEGCNSVKRAGGTVLVLDRATARFWGMAEPIVQAGAADRVLTIAEVAEALRGCFTSHDLVQCAEIQVQIAELLETAMRLAGTRMGHVTRRVRDSDRLHIVVQRGLGVDFFEQCEAIPADGEAAWCRAVRYRQPVVIPDITEEPGHPALKLHRLPYRAERAVPLMLRNPTLEVCGAITTLYPHAHAASAESADLERLAEQAAALVSRVS